MLRNKKQTQCILMLLLSANRNKDEDSSVLLSADPRLKSWLIMRMVKMRMLVALLRLMAMRLVRIQIVLCESTGLRNRVSSSSSCSRKRKRMMWILPILTSFLKSFNDSGDKMSKLVFELFDHSCVIVSLVSYFRNDFFILLLNFYFTFILDISRHLFF